MSSFRLSQPFLDQYADLTPEWGFTDEAGNSIGEITFLRSYSRLKDDGSKETWADACQRVVEGMFTIQREHCRLNKLPWDYKKAHRTAQDTYDRMFHFKWTPPGRGIANMGAPFVIEDWDGTPLQNCFSGETRFLTNEGFRAFKDLEGSTAIVLNKNNKWVDATISSFGVQPLSKLTVQRQGKTKEIFVTENHRWFARNKNLASPVAEFTTSELKPGYRLSSVFGNGIEGVTPSSFGVAHGFVYGDGRKSQGERNANGVSLFGNKDSALAPYFEPNSKRVNNASNVDAVEYTGVPNFFFKKPSLTETKSYLYGWLAGYFAADGSICNNQAVISSANYESLEFVKELAALIGIGTYGINKEVRISNLTNEESALYKIQLMSETLEEGFFIADTHREKFTPVKDSKNRPSWVVVSVEPTDRVETVYCAQVADSNSFVLEDHILTGNCAFVSTKTDFSEAMHFLMLSSMNGVGVGLDVLGAGRHKIKGADDSNPVTLKIPDTREGWAEALKTLLDSHLNGTSSLVFDYSMIRPPGTLIARFGGTASGPAVLEELLGWIDKLCLDRVGQTLTARDIADIANKIGTCVVSGSSRRSAELLLGPQSDEYMDLKNYDVNPERGEWGWMSNNSVFAEVGQSYTETAKHTVTNGEPGYVWMDTTRGFGRLKDSRDNKDHRAAGYNPCAEQSLENYEMCTLVETYPTRHESVEDYLKTLKVAYLYAKTVTLLPTVFERTNAVMARNRRIGLSQTGISTYVEYNGIAKWRGLCDEGYAAIQRLDEVYSDWLCVRNSIRTTTVKPSGSVSLLPGVSPGVHWNPASGYYIRRMTTGPGVVLDELRRAGYPVEESAYSKGQFVVSFPIKSPFKRSEKDVTIWEKVALAAEAQHWWSDNSVSVTVSYNPKTEAQYIEPILSLYEGRLKTVSFLPMNTNVYKQMPYEEIDEDQYKAICDNIFPILREEIYQSGDEALGEKFCATDKCEMPTQ